MLNVILICLTRFHCNSVTLSDIRHYKIIKPDRHNMFMLKMISKLRLFDSRVTAS